MPRHVLAVPALLATLALTGCGDEQPAPDPPAVELTIDSPRDAAVIRADKVELKGRVSPARAAVLVLGEPAQVVDGVFATDVALEEGANVIDVSATLPGRSAAFEALRVTYDPRVTVPDLAGVGDEEAADRLEALGLDPSRESVGGLIDEFRSGERRVCASDPPAGTQVEPGSDVVLLTAKRC
ncbi:MAG: PASTA domain-containing protein [Solirubrobacteraceae bacterium]